MSKRATPTAQMSGEAPDVDLTNKWVYSFDEVALAEKKMGGDWEGVRGLLGGKGANLAEMARIGVPCLLALP